MSKRKIQIIIMALIAMVAIVLSTVISTSKAEYEVSFHSETGEVVAIETVERNESVNPPNSPVVKYGNIFKKWDTDISKVKENMNVRPETESFIGKKNVFALSGAYGAQNDFVYVPFVLCGDVCLSGFDAKITYDKNFLELESVFNEDGAVVYNKDKEGVLYINYTSLKNTEADVDICSLKFKVKKEFDKTDIKTDIESICANGKDDSFYTPEYKQIDAPVYFLPNKGGDLTE